MPALRSLEILASPQAFNLGEPSLVVLHGGDGFLVRETLALLRRLLCPEDDQGWAWREFVGDQSLDVREVCDEAATVPLFGGATRAAVVRDADAFVSANRGLLEKLAAAPRRRGCGLVILEVKSFPTNTRLAKSLAGHGLTIETAVPPRFNLARWLEVWSRSRHDLPIAPATAQRLAERLAGQLGQIDQALARLAAATPATARRSPLPPETVDTLAGTPRDRAAWILVDAAGAGDAAQAVGLLGELLAAGENPIGISAQAAAVLRRFGTAARLLALPADAGRPAGVEAALAEAGVGSWPQAVAQARQALGQLGPRRARRLPLDLLDLDLALKGDAARGLRARLALERLICMMARAAAPPRRPG